MAPECTGRFLYWYTVDGTCAGRNQKNIKARMLGASDKRIELEFSRMLIRFNKMDARWIKRYKLDYEKIKNK